MQSREPAVLAVSKRSSVLAYYVLSGRGPAPRQL